MPWFWQSRAFSFPIIDGNVLTQTLHSAFLNGAFNHVPLINGTNRDEWRLQVAFGYDLLHNPLTDKEYLAAVTAFVYRQTLRWSTNSSM